MHGISVKEKAINLRKKGYSYNLISGKTGISKSTLYGWLSSIPYIPNQEVIERIGKARAASGEFKAKQKAKSIQEAKELAKKDVGEVSDRDLFMLGLGIYIGEGTKLGDTVRIINSDPRIIKLSIKWLIKKCGLTVDNFVIRLHIYPDNDENECIRHWSKETSVPMAQFQKTQIDTRKNKKLFKKGKLPYGTAHMTIQSRGERTFGSFLGRRIRAWMEEVL
jgi:hypothetical protein